MTLEEYILSIKDKRIGFIGAGISNLPLIKLLLMSGVKPSVCDIKEPEKLTMEDLQLIASGVNYRLGKTYLDNLDFDIIFRSPSFLPFEPQLRAAADRGCLVTSEMEVFFSLCPCKTIAVTGSDGKTTSSTIIARLLEAQGFTVHLGGNIGHPLLCELPFFKKNDIAVLELSSFQLHSMLCKPDIAVVTNISPNHLDKHKDYQDYIDAKKNIFLNQNKDSLLVLNGDDELCREFAQEAKGKVLWFSDGPQRNDGFCTDSGKIVRVDSGEKFPVINEADIILPGRHNILNYLAAFAATSSLVDNDTRKKVAGSFSGVAHRLEFVRELDGVRYINDSIGSSPSRTIAGLKAFSTKPVIILGGYDKQLPFDELGDEVCKRAGAAVLTGATAGKIRAAIEGSHFFKDSDIKLVTAADLREAVLRAREIAQTGDTVLFSPACASFDTFKNFEVRGDFYKKTVMEL